MRQINTMNLILEEDIFHAHAFFNFAYTFLLLVVMHLNIFKLNILGPGI